MRPDRVVIGADEERAILLMRSLYVFFVRNHDRVTGHWLGSTHRHAVS